MPNSLTSHLLTISSDAHQRATKHSFLQAAGNLSISKERLERWLTQDRIYVFVGYPKFVSLLTSRIPLRVSTASTANAPTTLEERTLALLSSALSNIVHEIEFFKQTARDHHLDITTRLDPALGPQNGSDLAGAVTKAYADFMVATATTGTFVDGLALLWATEKCYLDAWTYARSHTNTTPPPASDTARALEKFIQNWTSDAFRAFVDEIAAVLDAYAGRVTEKEFEELKRSAEGVWRWTLWYEERFWDGA